MIRYVSVQAVIQRINRKLKAVDEKLKVPRGRGLQSSLGEYYIVNFARNWIVKHHVDPEALGREMGVLKPWEEVPSFECEGEAPRREESKSQINPPADMTPKNRSAHDEQVHELEDLTEELENKERDRKNITIKGRLRSFIVRDVAIDALGRELCVLKEWEEYANE